MTRYYLARLFLSALLALSWTVANAQQKRDIQGIRLGMKWEEVQSTLKCDVYGCKLPDGLLNVAVALENRVSQLKYTFKSGLSPREMIAQVTEQYALKADPVSQRDIDFALSRRTEYDTDFGRVVTKTGGLIAHWSGPAGLDISLTVNGPAGGAIDYILLLTDQTMVESAKLAKEKARKDREAAERMINTKPKF